MNTKYGKRVGIFGLLGMMFFFCTAQDCNPEAQCDGLSGDGRHACLENVRKQRQDYAKEMKEKEGAAPVDDHCSRNPQHCGGEGPPNVPANEARGEAERKKMEEENARLQQENAKSQKE